MPSKDNLWLTPRIKTVSSGKWASKAHPEAKALRCLPSCPPCPPPSGTHLQRCGQSRLIRLLDVGCEGLVHPVTQAVHVPVHGTLCTVQLGTCTSASDQGPAIITGPTMLEHSKHGPPPPIPRHGLPTLEPPPLPTHSYPLPALTLPVRSSSHWSPPAGWPRPAADPPSQSSRPAAFC